MNNLYSSEYDLVVFIAAVETHQVFSFMEEYLANQFNKVITIGNGKEEFTFEEDGLFINGLNAVSQYLDENEVKKILILPYIHGNIFDNRHGWCLGSSATR